LVCPRCERPQSACICGWIRPADNGVLALLLLQHPDEQFEAKGTARLLSLSLARCTVWVGEQFDATALAQASAGAALLYPASAGSTALHSDGVPPRCLVVIDATWRKSRKMLMLNPLLQTLPRLALTAADATVPSRYAALRAAHRPQQLSTLEASVLALQQVEPAPERFAPLLAAMDGFVAAQLARRVGLKPGCLRPSVEA
jgi:DTW domain-containing protein YfiP